MQIFAQIKMYLNFILFYFLAYGNRQVMFAALAFLVCIEIGIKDDCAIKRFIICQEDYCCASEP